MTDQIGQPLYQQIADSLRSQIGAGTLAVGDPLPSTRKLMAIYSASNNVVRNAIEVLRQEGLVFGQPGKAVYVQATPESAERTRATLKSVGEEVAELRVEVKSLAAAQPSDVAEKLDALQATVGQLEADLHHLYDRLGQPYPHSTNTLKQKRRKSGA